MLEYPTSSREGLDEGNWQLEKEVNQAITAILSSLSQMNLEYSIHSQAVREFSQAFSSILTAYRNGNIDYKIAYELINKIKFGFVDGVLSVQEADRNRDIRNAQRAAQKKQDGRSSDSSYRRNMRVNNESFNVRFMASCATAECLMRSANFDLDDDEFQSYIVAATQDKRSDVMAVLNAALIVNPYLKFIELVVFSDIGYSAFYDNDFNSGAAFAMGKGAAYRLRLLNLSEATIKRAENTVSYITGGFLSGN